MDFSDPRALPFAELKSRGELPHLYKEGGTYFVTFRQFDAVELGNRQNRPSADRQTDPDLIVQLAEPKLILGSCALRRPAVAAMVRDAILHFAAERYHLHAWCIMPNHVHAVLTPASHGLSEILHSWKSFSSKRINRLLNLTGAFWERESFDHLCRSVEHAEWFIRYTEQNPVAAGLCARPEDWEFSSAF